MANSPPFPSGRGRTYPHAVKLWMPLLVFALFTLAVSLMGFAVFHSYKKSITADSQHDLAGIADLKIKQINTWMDERRSNAEILTEDPLFVDDAERWLRQGSPAGETRDGLLEHLVSLQRHYEVYGYKSVSLFDSHAMLRLSSAADEGPLSEKERKRMLESMQSGQVVFSDIHRENLKSGSRIEIELRAPLIVRHHGKPRTIGAILFRIDPYRYIFPLIQHWPTPSASAENLLVRRDGDEVVFLNELRHSRNVPLELRFSLRDENLLVTQAVLGKEGLAEGMDYRGVPVVGVLSKVPGTSWLMVSKIDKAEIYAPINRLVEWMVALMLVLIAAGGTLTTVWRNREIGHYREEIERRALSRHLEYLGKYANDIILLLDAQGRILDCNDRAAEAFGYSTDELLHLGIDDIRSIDFSISPVDRFRRVDEAGGALVFESTMVRRNGESFPVEASVRRLDMAGGVFYQGIVRDITERKKAEETLLFHSKILKSLAEGILLIRTSDGVIVFTNAQFDRMFGYEAGELVGRHVSVVNAPGERTPQQVADEINGELARKGVWSGEVHNIRKDGTAMWCHASVSEIGHPQFGKVWVSVQEDITERKRNEALAQQFGRLLQGSFNEIFLFDAGTLLLLQASAGASRNLGYAPDELPRLTALDLCRSYTQQDFEQLVAPLFSGEKQLLLFETDHWRKDGSIYPVEVRLQYMPGDPAVFLAVVQDITERKQHDRELTEHSQRVRALSHQLVTLKEEEMRRLSSELHDRCSPNLSALRLYFRLLSNAFPEQQSDGTGKLIDDISELLSDTTNAIREVCTDLRPAVLDYAGLWPALETLAQNFRRRTGIAVELVNEAGGLRFAPDTEVRLFRLVQEALTNCAKHAQARTIRIALARHGDGVLLTICDDGVGFDPDELGKSGHPVGLGLITMREGAEYGGGKFVLDASPGHGTCIKVRLPAETIAKA